MSTALTGGDNTTGANGNGDTSTDAGATDTGTTEQLTAEQQAAADQAAYDALSPEDKKLADDKKAADEAAAEEGKNKGAPEAYTDFTLPEGVTLSDDDLAGFSDLAKEAGMTQEMAQKFIDMEGKRMEAIGESFQKSVQDAFDKQQSDWLAELKNDPEYGGDNLDKNNGLAVKVINKFGNQGLKDVLDSSGMGNNPDLIKFIHRIGKAIAEDQLEGGDTNNGGDSGKTLAEKLYPNQGKA